MWVCVVRASVRAWLNLTNRWHTVVGCPVHGERCLEAIPVVGRVERI